MDVKGSCQSGQVHFRKSSGFAVQVQPEGGQRNEERIDVDGLPHVGAVIYPGQAYYSKVNCATGVLQCIPTKGAWTGVFFPVCWSAYN